MENLKKALDFIKLTNDFRKIERDILLSVEQRLENDIEHSYQLTLVSWYIATIENLNLNIDKIIKYALIHDMVEAYAGDTPLYSSDKEYIQSKKDRERKSASRLKQKFPEFPELHELIQKYEEKIDMESKFVYAVDKLLPNLSIYLDEGSTWKDHGITLEMIIDKNSSRISLSPAVKKYFDMLIILIREKPEYFIKQ